MSAQPEVIEGALASTLSPGNRAFNDALKTAMGAIHALDDAGCTVLDIDIRGGRPVLRIDRPPFFVQGVPRITWSSNKQRQAMRAAPFQGTQIEWIEREARPAKPRALL